jgi:hypothetical protein
MKVSLLYHSAISLKQQSVDKHVAPHSDTLS